VRDIGVILCDLSNRSSSSYMGL